ncbi:peptidase S8/S53 domain-containing protein [Syncephalis fuscata]|nr:peptidase S8/S53 domain-containing protein [Syncephalis fuscata]
MILRRTQQLAASILLLFCSTQHFAVNSTKSYKDDFYTKPNYNRPYIGSKITNNPVYATPYYVPTGVKTLHDMGFKGRGVKLGIIDSGINIEAHVFKKNHKHYHKYVDNEKNYENIPYCNNRGMSLAGIAVAKTIYFTGVAPEATLGTYRVFGCKGPTSTLLVLQALITAITDDQMKIIVLPEIAIVDEYGNRLRETIEDAAKHGVIMIVAASANNFMNPNYFLYQGLPVLSVGGFKQEYRLSHWFEEKTTGRRIEFTSRCSNMKYNFGKEVDVIPSKYSRKLKNHLDGFKKDDIALIWYKTTKTLAMRKRAKAIGMAALVIISDDFRAKTRCNIPLFQISEKDALFIKKGYENKLAYKYVFAEKYGYIENSSITVDTAGPQKQPFISPFYPDILAPSHKIYTTTIYDKRDKPYFSDISAAVAYVAGATALIVERNQNSLIDIGYVKTILQNNAIPVKENNVDSYIPVQHQGAGMINLSKLIDDERIHVEPSSINIEGTYANTANVQIKISSFSDTALLYKISHIPAEATPRVSYLSDMLSKQSLIAAVSFPGSISLQPKQKGEILVRISTPTSIQKNEIWSYSGYIVLDPNPRFNKPPSDRAVFIPYYGTVKG